MPKAKPETCPHPHKRRCRTAYGRYACGRCGQDITPPERRFEWKHSPRVTLCYGDRIKVSRDHVGGSFTGIFLWAETLSSGVTYHVVEVQRWTHDGKLREDWAQHRWVSPEVVSQAPGVRERAARAAHEEVNA